MKSFCVLLFLVTIAFTATAQVAPVIIQTKNTESLIPEGIAVDERTGLVYVIYSLE